MGGRRRRERVEPTEEWEQLALLCRWPEQLAYEEIRPLTLFGVSVAERARETGTAERIQPPIAGGASDRPDPYCLRPNGCPVRDTSTGPHSAPSVRTNSSTSSPRALAKPRSSPEISKPHFCRTRTEPRLSLAARA